jgi:hypothetical protein
VIIKALGAMELKAMGRDEGWTFLYLTTCQRGTPHWLIFSMSQGPLACLNFVTYYGTYRDLMQ